jgi:hypothetical protein
MLIAVRFVTFDAERAAHTHSLTSSEPLLPLTFFMTLPVPRPLCMQWFVSDWDDMC